MFLSEATLAPFEDKGWLAGWLIGWLDGWLAGRRHSPFSRGHVGWKRVAVAAMALAATQMFAAATTAVRWHGGMFVVKGRMEKPFHTCRPFAPPWAPAGIELSPYPPLPTSSLLNIYPITPPAPPLGLLVRSPPSGGLEECKANGGVLPTSGPGSVRPPRL